MHKIPDVVGQVLRPIERHSRVVLSFSGGKDSLACLYLCKPYWDRITVMWANAGASHFETLAQMEEIRKLPVRFVEVRPEVPQPQFIAQHGLPADVVPVESLRGVPELSGRPRGPMIQSWLSCCGALLWRPLERAIADYGATLVIRGQRNGEDYKGILRSGDCVNGIEYLYPIETWSHEQVFAFLVSQGVPLTSQYQYVNESLDCWDCTAFLGEGPGRAQYLRERHPERLAEWRKKLEIVEGAVRNSHGLLAATLGAVSRPS